MVAAVFGKTSVASGTVICTASGVFSAAAVVVPAGLSDAVEHPVSASSTPAVAVSSRALLLRFFMVCLRGA